ncbi:cytochrome P450 [Nonomuraea sp. NPDC050556]|uniref:cytochrome P450 n=1 Tax=Nonomuraea sp. NPDC050556 TaxID=3364369 RepID=UPI003790A2F0
MITVEDLDRDPYPIYAHLRRNEPVAWVEAVNVWFVTRWADVERVGGDPETFSAQVDTSPVEAAFGSPTIITVDGPVHKELRRSLDTKYRPREVLTYIDDLVGPIVEEQLSRLKGTAELMADYFEPISVLSLGKVLGLADLDAETLRGWFARLSEGATNFERSPAKQAISDSAAREIDEHVGALMDAPPHDSTIAHLMGIGRPAAYVMPTFKVILLGGMQEPGHAGGTTIAGLLRNPEQHEAVKADPALVPMAVEEALRWVSPIGTQTRQVTRPVTLGGVDLPEGAPIAALLSSANRDETIYRDADTFDLFRERRTNAAFGFGPHYCTGHAFSRHQIQLAVQALVQKFPGMRLTHEPVFRGWEFRAPSRLDVAL